MEINRIYDLMINEYLYIKILYDGNEVFIISPGNTPKDLVSIVTDGNKSILKVGNLPRCTIDLITGDVKTNLKVIPTAAIRNHAQAIKTKGTEYEYISNDIDFKKQIKRQSHNKTELHTHFMEILSGEQYLNVLLKYTEYFGVDKNDELCEAYPTNRSNPKELDESNVFKWISCEEVFSDPKIYNSFASQLQLPIDGQIPFETINKILRKRVALLELASYLIGREKIELLKEDSGLYNEVGVIKSDIKAGIYVDILLESLETLKQQGIKYVEMSFSTPSTIAKIHERLQEIDIDGIEFNFLLSENRNADPKRFREYYKDEKGKRKRNKDSVVCWIDKLLKKGYITGFDLMGMEQEIVPKDYIKDYTDNSSLYDKLEPIILKLHEYQDDNLVCRLHAGEFAYNSKRPDNKSNPERILEIVDSIAYNNNITIPPPSIRLGHGLHINKNDNYLNLLKKYNVTIEINASSNFALGNIKDIHDIPYNWYIKNNIPVVLGTDGGGFYLTTPLVESNIAQVFGGSKVARTIKQNDSEELKRRGI